MNEIQFAALMAGVWATFFLIDGSKKLAVLEFGISVVCYLWTLK